MKVSTERSLSDHILIEFRIYSLPQIYRPGFVDTAEQGLIVIPEKITNLEDLKVAATLLSSGWPVKNCLLERVKENSVTPWWNKNKERQRSKNLRTKVTRTKVNSHWNLFMRAWEAMRIDLPNKVVELFLHWKWNASDWQNCQGTRRLYLFLRNQMSLPYKLMRKL